MWLLQQKLLQQLHTYVYLLLPDLVDPPVLSKGGGATLATVGGRIGDEDIVVSNGDDSPSSAPVADRKDSSSTNSEVVFSVKGGGGGSAAVEEVSKIRGKTQEMLLSELTTLERQAVFRLDAANNSDDLKQFAKLLRYFRGKQHLEEIMYYENISRSQILIILDKFRDVLVTTLHPDPVTSVFLN